LTEPPPPGAISEASSLARKT
jgi:hypothetical protein